MNFDRSPSQQTGDSPGQAEALQQRSFTGYPWHIVAVAVLSLFLGLVFADFLFIAARSLALLFVAIVIAEALSPVVNYLERWMPRAAGVVTVYLILILILAGLAWIVIPPLARQAEQAVSADPNLVTQAQEWFNNWDVPGRDRIIGVVESQLNRIGGALAGLPFLIVSTAIDIVLVVFMSLYWLLVVRPFRSFVLSLVPEHQRDYAGETFDQFGRMMGGYVRGAVIQGIIIGILAYIGLLVIGVQFALVLAVIAGLLELIPVIGPLIATVPIVGIALLDSPTTALIALVFWIAVQQFENQVLTPNIMRSVTDLSPFLVLFAIFIGGEVAGILGALVAIPLSGVIKVFVVRILAPWIRHWAGVTDVKVGESQGETG